MGLFQGFIPKNDGGYQLFNLALYEDGSFVQSVQSPVAGSGAVTIESGSWIVHDDLVILSQDGVKDQRWKKTTNGLVLSGVSQKSDHWQLWKLH